MKFHRIWTEDLNGELMRFVGNTKLFHVVKAIEGAVAFSGWVVG